MHPHAEESHRQFAARVREVMVHERHRMMCEMLRQGDLDRHRRHRSFGLPLFLRRQIAAEERGGIWHLLLEIPLRTGSWLFLGGEWSTMPLTVRLLYPDSVTHVIESDPDRLTVAQHQWLEEQDRVFTESDDVVFSGIENVVCCWPATHPQREEVLERAARAGAQMLVVRGTENIPQDFVLTHQGKDEWAVWMRSVSSEQTKG